MTTISSEYRALAHSGVRSIEVSGDRAQRLKELENVSRAARETRGKLSGALGTAKGAEVELKSRYGHLRQSTKDGILVNE
jgi:hypothetical protein